MSLVVLGAKQHYGELFFEASHWGCVSFGENTNMLSMVISKQPLLADHACIKLRREN